MRSCCVLGAVFAIALSGGPMGEFQLTPAAGQTAKKKPDVLAKVGDPLVTYTPKKPLGAYGTRKCETC